VLAVLGLPMLVGGQTTQVAANTSSAAQAYFDFQVDKPVASRVGTCDFRTATIVYHRCQEGR
jgi:hypothetical protein